MKDNELLLHQVVQQQPFPLLFVTISGAHLYGFPSSDSDFDLRGVHVLPLEKIVRFKAEPETIELSEIYDRGVEIDLVTHDVKKFLMMLLKKNGYVLEQLFSPLILHTTKEHEELKLIAQGCITKFHFYHYSGFAETQWKLFVKEPKIKTLLYVFRVLLSGIYLMRTGEIQSNLQILMAEFRLPYISELIHRKTEGSEKEKFTDDFDFYRNEYESLRQLLESSAATSKLPERPSLLRQLDDFLAKIRLTAI